MTQSRTVAGFARAAAICGLAASCGDGQPAAPILDAPAPTIDGGSLVDGAQRPDGGRALTWVDFSISGCDGAESSKGPGDAGLEVCRGPAPLTVQFTAIADGPIDVHRWDFGTCEDSVYDASVPGQECQDTSSLAAPQYTFLRPGSYTVTLTAGGNGTATTKKTDIIVVRAAALGAPCTLDDQCSDGWCLCGQSAGEECPAALGSGICSRRCDADAPCASGACADLRSEAGGASPWRQTICVAGCANDDDCPFDLSCRELRRGDSGGWILGCFPGSLLGDMGAPCADAAGQPDDNLCLSGYCWSQGSRGMCSADCAAMSCPNSAACATFADSALGAQCLRRCTGSSDDCKNDPWLACELPGGSGAKSFTVSEKDAENGYCAPKSCTDAGDCGFDGICDMDGFCGPSPG